MLCDHLRPIELALQASGARETYRGRPWSDNCREWVYFDRYLDLAKLRAKFPLAAVVVDHIHRGTHDGFERGIVCSEHHDAIVGAYELGPPAPAFPA